MPGLCQAAPHKRGARPRPGVLRGAGRGTGAMSDRSEGLIVIDQQTTRLPDLTTAVGPSVDEVMAWLSAGPPLDDVAAKLRYLRLVQSELNQCVELIRQHALIALGERSLYEQPPDGMCEAPF